MNYKIILIILLILFLLGNYFRESFTDTDTHHLLAVNAGSIVSTDTFQLTNIISRSTSGDKEDDFKNLYNPFGKEHFDQNSDYEQGQLPILVLESYNECPTLHTLYKSLKKFKTVAGTEEEAGIGAGTGTDAGTAGTAGTGTGTGTGTDAGTGTVAKTDTKYEQNENVEGYKFRSLIQSVFYNITEPIEVDYKLFDMFVKDKFKEDLSNNQPNLKLYLKNITAITDKTSFNGKSLNYIDSVQPLDSVQPQYSFNHKEATFGVQENFERIDILRFMDFAFTTLCWGALHINLLKPLDNHFYAFPCQNNKCNTISNKPHFFYLLPVKVRQICYEEGSEYTRAKCNGCASNIIVFFNQVPNKFKNLSHINQTDQNKSITSTVLIT
jgi:hypothetical protein